MALPMDINDSGTKGRYDPAPIEVMRSEMLMSPRTRDSTVIVHGTDPIDPVYGQNTMPPRTFFERLGDGLDCFRNCCSRYTCRGCREIPGFVFLILFLLFLGIFIAAAILIFVLAVPGTQTSQLVADGQGIEILQREYDFPPEAEKSDTSFVKTAGLHQCSGFGFSCTARPDERVSTAKRCNGVEDCSDGSDELSCKKCSTNYECPNSQFGSKKTKHCLHPDTICDGVNHCPDGWDETHFCKEKCHDDDFPCGNTTVNGKLKCLNKMVLCDGHKDCPLGNDEKDCQECQGKSKHCAADGKCISAEKVCDGEKDCSDGSDEQGCDCVACSGTGKFLCDDKTCIKMTDICNGIPDCKDGADEQQCPQTLKATEAQ